MISPRDKNGLTESEFLSGYDPSKWDRPSVTVDIILYSIHQKSILLIKRGGHPFIGKWALPGGFIKPDETAPEAAKRELFEETGAKIESLKLLNVYSEPKRDPRTRIMSLVYFAFTEDIPKIKADDDADDARWFKTDISGTQSNAIVSLVSDKLRLSFEYKITEGNIEPEYRTLENELAADHSVMIVEFIETVLKNNYL